MPQPTVNYVCQQNVLYIADPTNLGSVLPVVALNGFQGLGGTKSSIKTTNLDSIGYDEFAPGLVDPGKPSGSVILNYGDASHQLCQKLLGLGSLVTTQFFYGQADSATAPTAPGGVMTPPVNAAIAAPGTVTPSTSTTGGTLAAATYFYKLTALNSAGETTVSPEATQVTTGATSTVTLNWSAVTGATGYRLYRSTVTNQEKFLVQLGAVITYIDTGALTPTLVTPPTSNTTQAYARSGWLFSGFVAEFAFQSQVNNVAMCKLTIQATGSRTMIPGGGNLAI